MLSFGGHFMWSGAVDLTTKEKHMYDSLGLAAIKDDAFEVGAAAVGTLAGVAVAQFVTKQVDGMLTKDAAPSFPGARQVSSLIPVAVGLGIYTYGVKRMGGGVARDAAAGVAAGMVAFGVGKLVASFIPQAKAALPEMGLAGVYDYSLGYNTAEYGPGGVEAYMMAGSPVSFEPARLNAAPVDIQQLNGAPVSINTVAPISTALVA